MTDQTNPQTPPEVLQSDREARPVMTITPNPEEVTREAIARIIDPETAKLRDHIANGDELWREKHGFKFEYYQNAWGHNGGEKRWNEALAKADAILARITPNEPAETAGEGFTASVDRVDRIYAVLRDWRLNTIGQEDEPSEGYPLVDAVSEIGGTIDSGEGELAEIAFAIGQALSPTDRTDKVEIGEVERVFEAFMEALAPVIHEWAVEEGYTLDAPDWRASCAATPKRTEGVKSALRAAIAAMHPRHTEGEA